MKVRQQAWTGFIYALCMMAMIFDAKTAVAGTKDGIILCLYTVIPSLFPFILLSILLSTSLTGNTFKLLRPIGKLLGIPKGAESILLLGFLGGYPVGAQAVTDAWRNGKLSAHDAKRMLGFCSNAGPAFIFGMASGLLTEPISVWILWAIHMLSALAVGMLLPGKSLKSYRTSVTPHVSFVFALEKTVKVMANICSWIILFRVILAFANRWLLRYMPQAISIVIAGLLELTNGCVGAYELTSEGLRFLFLSAFLGFGGLCVYGQTHYVTKGLGTGAYFPGKALQGSISVLLAYFAQWIIFPEKQIYKLSTAMIVFILLCTLSGCIFISRKKTVAFPKKIIYNRLKSTTS